MVSTTIDGRKLFDEFLNTKKAASAIELYKRLNPNNVPYSELKQILIPQLSYPKKTLFQNLDRKIKQQTR
jgi:hypothetical protein